MLGGEECANGLYGHILTEALGATLCEADAWDINKE